MRRAVEKYNLAREDFERKMLDSAVVGKGQGGREGSTPLPTLIAQGRCTEPFVRLASCRCGSESARFKSYKLCLLLTCAIGLPRCVVRMTFARVCA